MTVYLIPMTTLEVIYSLYTYWSRADNYCNERLARFELMLLQIVVALPGSVWAVGDALPLIIMSLDGCTSNSTMVRGRRRIMVGAVSVGEGHSWY